MAILQGDIKLVASEVMDDVDEGGGGPTSVIIQDGASNEIFPDISELDRAGGRVSKRKLFASVQTANRDTYLGSNIVIGFPPDDPNVSITLFSTGEMFDEADAAQDRMESYLTLGPEWGGYLLENHVQGQRSIQLFQRIGSQLPPIGRTLVLIWHEGLNDEKFQYVRVTAVEAEQRTFTYNGDQDYQALVVTCDLSDALRASYIGSPPSRSYTRANNATVVRDTTVADASNYYGVVKLTEDATIGDFAVDVDTVYSQLVPNARTETSVLDQKPNGDAQLPIATSPRAVSVAASPHTNRIRIGQENRGFNYVNILKPLPVPGSVQVSYMALGQWYTISDNGDGTIGEEGGVGVGVVIYTTGSISVTFKSMPDDGSNVIFSWGERLAFTNRAGQAGFRAPEYVFKVKEGNIEPGSLTLTWTSNSDIKTATDNGSGKITGDGVGEVDYPSGTIYIRPTAMLDPGGEIDVAYDYSTKVTEILPASSHTPDGGGFITVTLAQQPAAGSLILRWATAKMVSETSGSSMGASNNSKTANTSTTVSLKSWTKAQEEAVAVGVPSFGSVPAPSDTYYEGGSGGLVYYPTA